MRALLAAAWALMLYWSGARPRKLSPKMGSNLLVQYSLAHPCSTKSAAKL